MSPNSKVIMAIVLEGGQVQDVILENWAADVALPRCVVVDYDIDDLDDAEIVHFTVAHEPARAGCHHAPVARLEDLLGTGTLVPSQVVDAMLVKEKAAPNWALRRTQALLQRILAFDDARSAGGSEAGKRDNYDKLFRIVADELSDLQAALGGRASLDLSAWPKPA